jgi:hypothetical protein
VAITQQADLELVCTLDSPFTQVPCHIGSHQKLMVASSLVKSIQVKPIQVIPIQVSQTSSSQLFASVHNLLHLSNTRQVYVVRQNVRDLQGLSEGPPQLIHHGLDCIRLLLLGERNNPVSRRVRSREAEDVPCADTRPRSDSPR